ncbi:hypothetical protein DFH08DRAFT_824889 [Mycena albidolilacea]|uniref:Uncharacterized protein n=1 Tax=Mycena albidolilacea TaxID=1033008 RepID=A0AAD6Z2X2_9AGAR|nr:hypothetical protein DFH08DRAFT_824889 [Mycena albidolilacea]
MAAMQQATLLVGFLNAASKSRQRVVQFLKDCTNMMPLQVGSGFDSGVHSICVISTSRFSNPQGIVRDDRTRLAAAKIPLLIQPWQAHHTKCDLLISPTEPRKLSVGN